MSSKSPREYSRDVVAQLSEQEKWLINALADVRKQRNCLQVERLHLESLEAKLLQSIGKGKPTNEGDSASCSTKEMQIGGPDKSGNNSIGFEKIPLDSGCNDEELDLTIRESTFDQAEDFEEYDDDVGCNAEDLLIDMNMLMNGATEEDLACPEEADDTTSG